MLRYIDVIADEARRMRLARISRGHDPRFLWQVGATARGVGALFVRSYERGERVHLAMLARGWAGAMPRMSDEATTGRQWRCGLAPVAAALALAVTGWVIA
jgi:cobalt/nickel transport system permease protein